MSKPKLKPKVLMEATMEGSQLIVHVRLQDFKAKDNKEQKALRAFVMLLGDTVQEMDTTEEQV